MLSLTPELKGFQSPQSCNLGVEQAPQLRRHNAGCELRDLGWQGFQSWNKLCCKNNISDMKDMQHPSSTCTVPV